MIDINLGKMLDSWGLGDDKEALMNIAYNHESDEGYRALGELGLLFALAYHPQELPNLIKVHSDRLGCSVQDYLEHVEDGALHIVEEINGAQ